MIKWLKNIANSFKKNEEEWEYGTMSDSGKIARRHKKNGNAQFILWKKGDQKSVDGIGHKEDKWVDFGTGWDELFVPNNKPRLKEYSFIWYKEINVGKETIFTKPFRTKVCANSEIEAMSKVKEFAMSKMALLIYKEEDFSQSKLYKFNEKAKKMDDMFNKKSKEIDDFFKGFK